MRTTVRVIQGRLAESEPHRTSAIEAAYQHFRLRGCDGSRRLVTKPSGALTDPVLPGYRLSSWSVQGVGPEVSIGERRCISAQVGTGRASSSAPASCFLQRAAGTFTSLWDS